MRPTGPPQPLSSSQAPSKSSRDGSQTGSGSSKQKRAPLALPDHDPTTPSARETTVPCMLTRWNFKQFSSLCCSYHAALLDLGVEVQKLVRKPCNASFRPTSDWQCGYCGLMYGHEEEDCEVCPEEVFRKQSPTCGQRGKPSGSRDGATSKGSGKLMAL